MSTDAPHGDPTRPVEDPTRPVEVIDTAGSVPETPIPDDATQGVPPAPAAPTEQIPQASTRALPQWQAPGPSLNPPPMPYPEAPAGAQPTAPPPSAAPPQAAPYPVPPATPYPVPSAQPYPSLASPSAPPPPAAPPQQWVPPVGYAGAQPAHPETNTSALVLLILSGLLTLSCYFSLVGIGPLVVAIIAMTKQNTDPAGSRRLSRIGWIVLAVMGAIALVGFIVFIAALIASDTSPNYN